MYQEILQRTKQNESAKRQNLKKNDPALESMHRQVTSMLQDASYEKGKKSDREDLSPDFLRSENPSTFSRRSKANHSLHLQRVDKSLESIRQTCKSVIRDYHHINNKLENAHDHYNQSLSHANESIEQIHKKNLRSMILAPNRESLFRKTEVNV